MPLSYHDQVNLLKDILNNHQIDCCGSVSECEQLERLAQSLMANEQIDQPIKNVLQDIFSYSQRGKNASHLGSHIESHQQDLLQWVQHFDQYS